MTDHYEFPGLPLEPIRPGTTVVVAGPSHAGTRNLGLRMLAGSDGEGTTIVTTNQRAVRIVDDCKQVGIEVQSDDSAIIDCVGDADTGLPARLLTVSSPSDLTGIGMRFSDVATEFMREGIDRIRTGIFSVSTLLTLGDLRTVSRFIHTLVGRIDVIDGFGVLLVDPSNHDDRAIGTLSQFCTGRIDVRRTDEGQELRVGGLGEQPHGWTPFDLTPL
jgi:KaiC/GvpD/RAD55 family RecA-like ATPase